MKYRSVFDIIGPIMVGPSSSHTAGAVRIGRIARRLFGRLPEEAELHFYGSFAQTYRGHATDVAITAGLLDFETDDSRIPVAMELAARQNLKIKLYAEEAVPVHPNTVRLVLRAQGETLEVTGLSIGGGAVQITELSGFALRLSGECPAMLILHQDAYGVVAAVTACLTHYRINISHMEVSRMEKGQLALMAIETDQSLPQEVIERIRGQEHVVKLILLSEAGA